MYFLIKAVDSTLLTYYLFYLIYICVVLGVEPKVLHMLGSHSIIVLYF